MTMMQLAKTSEFTGAIQSRAASSNNGLLPTEPHRNGSLTAQRDHHDEHAHVVRSINNIHLGRLVADLNMATSKELEHAAHIGRYGNLPLGLGLVMLGCFSRKDLTNLIRAQSMLIDGLVSESQIAEANKISQREPRLTLHAALGRTGWVCDPNVKSNTLGGLLVAAGLLTPLKLAWCHTIANSTMLPLGRVLTLTNTLSCPAVSAALSVQTAIRMQKFNRAQGIRELQFLSSRSEQILQMQSDLTAKKGRNRPLLGELFIEAGILSATEVINAVEISKPDQKMIGEILCEFSWVTEELLHGALALQKLAEFQTITRQNAVSALRLIHTTGTSFKSALDAVLPTIKRPFRREYIEQVLKFASPATALCNKTNELKNYFVSGSIEADQALILSDYCQRGSMSVTAALVHLGWTVNINVKDCRAITVASA